MIPTHISGVAPDCGGPLKDALPTELLRRGKLNFIQQEKLRKVLRVTQIKKFSAVADARLRLVTENDAGVP